VACLPGQTDDLDIESITNVHGEEIRRAYYRCRPVMMSSMVKYTSNVQRSAYGGFELRHALWPIMTAAGGCTMPSKDKVISRHR